RLRQPRELHGLRHGQEALRVQAHRVRHRARRGQGPARPLGTQLRPPTLHRRVTDKKHKLSWQETKVPGGANVVFDGPPPSALRLWGGVSALFTAAPLVYITYFRDHPHP